MKNLWKWIRLYSFILRHWKSREDIYPGIEGTVLPPQPPLSPYLPDGSPRPTWLSVKLAEAIEQRQVMAAAEAQGVTMSETPNLNLTHEEIATFYQSSAGRAEKIRRFLAEYYDDNDAQASLGDLLADCHHFCRAESLDFTAVAALGAWHFGEKIKEEFGERNPYPANVDHRPAERIGRRLAEYFANQAELDQRFDEQHRRILEVIEPTLPGLLVHKPEHPETVDGCPFCLVIAIAEDSVIDTYLSGQPPRGTEAVLAAYSGGEDPS